MTTCPSCKTSIAGGALKCPNCGLTFDETSGATAILPSKKEQSIHSSAHSTESTEGARFSSGTILAERYRIVSLVGRGGMGEVYKAEDLKLKQIVALKFLPEAIALDGAALARFQNEVRITRQISHPNVCRVYDIGETKGLHFLSMEFIDGEDLSHLLRRIGRLPGDKANEIARQICAGLAAAHDNGVLHRDLKPANIMIDGRGKARITDFGVAVVAKELLGAEAASGTPAYMAPEQLKGKEVTQRSDIYSLGLVLYELFTGKKVYDSDNIRELIRLHESSSPTSPSSHVQHIDPLVERVIMRCLEKEPAKRPATAIQVAAALPGGDPLAAALAAGETPSPEMVAASGEKTGLRPAVAVALMASIIAIVALNLFTGRKTDWPASMLRENSPDTLAHKAQDIIQRLGYSDRPADSAWGLNYDMEHRQYIERTAATSGHWSRSSSEQPTVLYFWYRQSPRYLAPGKSNSFGWIMEDDPPSDDVAGMVSIKLDSSGHMSYFKAVPRQVDTPIETPTQPDWAPLFAAAGLEPATFTATKSTWTPETAFDARAAWTGTCPNQPDIPIRLEAAAYRGKPTYFNLIAPWQRPAMDQEFQESRVLVFMSWFVLLLVFSALAGAVLLARSNLKKGRGDRRGAARLSFVVFAAAMLAWVFGADHRPIHNEVIIFLSIALSQTLFVTGVIWVLYIALEPYVRRRWPETIISWSRVLGGQLHDPLVGRDVLVGVLAGVAGIMIYKIQLLVRFYTNSMPPIQDTQPWLGTRQFIGAVFMRDSIAAIFGALFLFFVMFLLRILARRRWLAALLFMLITTPLGFAPGDPLSSLPFGLMFTAVVAIICLRFGLLAMAALFFMNFLPLAYNFSAWYTSYVIAAHVIVLALAGWAFHTSLGGEKIFKGGLLED